jgi:hypothetical protein
MGPRDDDDKKKQPWLFEPCDAKVHDLLGPESADRLTVTKCAIK